MCSCLESGITGEEQYQEQAIAVANAYWLHDEHDL